MAREREHKYEIPEGTLRELARRPGARKARPQTLINEYFDFADRHLYTQGRRLRVRRRGRDATVTLKVPRGRRGDPERDSDELDIRPRDAAEAKRFFRELQLVPLVAYRTRRREWAEPGCRIALDRVLSIPDGREIGLFCEIETAAPSVRLDLVASSLGLRPEWLEKRSYVEILLDQDASASPLHGGPRGSPRSERLC